VGDPVQEVVVWHTFIMRTGLLCYSYEGYPVDRHLDALLTPITLPYQSSQTHSICSLIYQRPTVGPARPVPQRFNSAALCSRPSSWVLGYNIIAPRRPDIILIRSIAYTDL